MKSLAAAIRALVPRETRELAYFDDRWLLYLASELKQHPPAHVDIAVAIAASRSSMPESVPIYLFGSFRRPYAALRRTANALADFYLEMKILPLVIPVTRREWRIEVAASGRIYHRLRRSGFVLFYR